MLNRINETYGKAEKAGNVKHMSVLKSFSQAYTKWGGLTPNQTKYFESIEDSYSPAAMEADAEWVETLKDPEYRKKLKIVAEYYGRTGYYGILSSNVRMYLNGNSPTVPNRQKVQKMMDNKYAQQVLKSTLSPPVFAAGDLVQFRSTVKSEDVIGGSWTWFREMKTRVMTIVEIDSRPITRALSYHPKNGGTRYYKVLPFGTTELIDVMERDLKRPTKKLLRGE